MIEKNENPQGETSRAERETGEEGVAQTLLAVMMFSNEAVKAELLKEGFPTLERLRTIEHEQSNIHAALNEAVLAWVSHSEHPSGQFRVILNARPDLKKRIDEDDMTSLEEIATCIDLRPAPEGISSQLHAVLNARPDLKCRIEEGDSSARAEAESFVDD